MRKQNYERGKNTRTLGQALKQYFKAHGLDKKIAYALIKKNLHNIIPPEYMQDILEVAFVENNFYIKVNSPSVMSDLSFRKEEIKTKCNIFAETEIIKNVIIF